MEDDINFDHDSLGARFVVDPINGTKRSINLGLYSKSFSYTKHYNSIKMKYKSLLLTWILATFVSLGYVLSGKEVAAPIDKMIAIALVAIFSSRGVLLILTLDAEIYHRLLNASFSANLEMERSGISHSKMHTNMMNALHPEAVPSLKKEYEQSTPPLLLRMKKALSWLASGDSENGIDPVFYDGILYCSICFCLWCIAGSALALYFHYHAFKLLSTICWCATPVISFACCAHIMRKISRSGINSFNTAA